MRGTTLGGLESADSQRTLGQGAAGTYFDPAAQRGADNNTVDYLDVRPPGTYFDPAPHRGSDTNSAHYLDVRPPGSSGANHYDRPKVIHEVDEAAYAQVPARSDNPAAHYDKPRAGADDEAHYASTTPEGNVYSIAGRAAPGTTGYSEIPGAGHRQGNVEPAIYSEVSGKQISSAPHGAVDSPAAKTSAASPRYDAPAGPRGAGQNHYADVDGEGVKAHHDYDAPRQHRETAAENSHYSAAAAGSDRGHAAGYDARPFKPNDESMYERVLPGGPKSSQSGSGRYQRLSWDVAQREPIYASAVARAQDVERRLALSDPGAAGYEALPRVDEDQDSSTTVGPRSQRPSGEADYITLAAAQSPRASLPGTLVRSVSQQASEPAAEEDDILPYMPDSRHSSLSQTRRPDLSKQSSISSQVSVV